MARTVAEASACFDAIVGFDPGDPYSRPEPLDDPRDVDVRGLRIGWLPRVGNRLVDPDVLASCEAAVRHLEGRGAVVETVEEDVTAFEQTFLVFFQGGLAARVGPHMAAFGDKIARSLRESVERGARWSAVDWANALGQRTAMYRRVQALLPSLRFPRVADHLAARARRRSRSLRADHDRRARPPARSAGPGIPICGRSTSRVIRPSRCRVGGPPTVCPSGCRSSAPGTPTAACSPWPPSWSASARVGDRCPLAA